MKKHKASIHKAGRTTKCRILDVMGKGMHIMMAKLAMGIPDGADGEYNANEMDVENWGLHNEMEVEDDGSLDV